MNWKVRLGVIIAAAVVLYGLLAWTLDKRSQDSQNPQVEHLGDRLEGRLEGVELALVDLAGQGAARSVDPESSLYALLARQPEEASGLLVGLSSEALVSHLGWPNHVQGLNWWYSARKDGVRVLQISLDGQRAVSSVLWIAAIPE